MFGWWFSGIGNIACKFVTQVFSLSCLREWSLLVENRKWAGDTDRHQCFQGDCLSWLLLPGVLGWWWSLALWSRSFSSLKSKLSEVKALALWSQSFSSLKSNQSGHIYSTLATPFLPTELGFKGDPSSEAPQNLSMGMEWKIHSLLSVYSFVRWKVTLESW